MKTKIELDIKSLLIGAAAAAVFFFGTGASSGTAATPTGGRFQMHLADNGSAAVLDTTTGQAWTAVINTSGQAVGPTGVVSFYTTKL